MAKFTINEGLPFKTVFILKEPRSTTPLDLTGSTGTFNLSSLGESSCKVLEGIEMTIEEELDAINGRFTLTLTAEQTSGLGTKLAFEEDGYPTLPTYKARLDITSPDYGLIYVYIPKIYIVQDGEVCPAS